LALAAVAIATVALATFYLLEAARMAGAWSGVLDAELRALVWDSGRMPIIARALGLGLLAWGLTVRGGAVFAGAGSLAIAVSFTLTGHTADLSVGPRALVSLHVLIAEFWVGSLVPLVLVATRENGATAGGVVARFTSVATLTVPLIALAGAWLAYALGVRAEMLVRPYGLLLVAKLAAFALLMLLAALNKWRLGPRLATDSEARAAFVRTVFAEGVLVVGVVIATATLTTYFSPEM
jgi:putative copper export protein